VKKKKRVWVPGRTEGGKAVSKRDWEKNKKSIWVQAEKSGEETTREVGVGCPAQPGTDGVSRILETEHPEKKCLRPIKGKRKKTSGGVSDREKESTVSQTKDCPAFAANYAGLETKQTNNTGEKNVGESKNKRGGAPQGEV